MGNIHQHLAALTEIEQRDIKISNETALTFKKKELFEGFERVLHMHDEERREEEAGAKEVKSITTSIAERIGYQHMFNIKNVDMQFQREVANSVAKATVMLPNGKNMKNVPVTFLMYIEKYLIRQRNLFMGIPTLDTTIKWKKDEQIDMVNVHKTAAPEHANKTEKTRTVIHIAPATKEHKEQAELFDKDVIVGHYEKTRVTGMLTPLQKANLIGYIDECIVAIRIAKSKANNTAVGNEKIAEELFKGIYDAMLK